MDSPSPRPPELDELEHARLLAAREHATDLAGAARERDDEGLSASLAALLQVASQVDVDAFINAVHVPKEAGEWEAELREIMGRIPDGFGRWVECDKGWYPIVVSLHRQLAALFPDYIVEQIKQKYGSLQVYVALGDYQQQLSDPADLEPVLTVSWDHERNAWSDQAEYERCSEARRDWRARLAVYLETEAGKRQREAVDALQARGRALIEAAEAEAARTCELCGRPGEMRCTLSAAPWYQVMCAECGVRNDCVSPDEWQVWWDDEGERWHKQNMRALFLKHRAGQRILVASDQDWKLSFAAEWAQTSAAAARRLEEEWDEIFIGDDEVGRVVAALLVERYREASEAERARQEKMVERGETPLVYLGRPKGSPAIHRLDHDLDLHELGQMGCCIWNVDARGSHLAC